MKVLRTFITVVNNRGGAPQRLLMWVLRTHIRVSFRRADCPPKTVTESQNKTTIACAEAYFYLLGGK